MLFFYYFCDHVEHLSLLIKTNDYEKDELFKRIINRIDDYDLHIL